MKRPHEWPCVCQDCCVPWDPQSGPSDSTYAMRASPRLAPVDQGMALAEFCREMMATACRVLGKTEAQIRAMAEEMGMAERPMRKHWSEQYDREPGSDDE